MDEIDLLLDTDVLIDLLRQFPPALAWASENADLRIGIPVIVQMELIQGARNRQELEILSQQLSAYRIAHLESGDSAQALQWFEQFHLSAGAGLLDCLIAAIASRLQKPLYTFNTKHFSNIPSLQLRTPYSR